MPSERREGALGNHKTSQIRVRAGGKLSLLTSDVLGQVSWLSKAGL
jgi:hypothetical protein